MSETDCRRQVWQKLLSAAASIGAAGSPHDLVRAADTLSGLPPEEKRELKRLLALAYLVCFHTDRRNLKECIRYSAEVGDWPLIEELLRLARLYGLTSAVAAIRQLGREHNLAALLVPDFKTWFKARGVKWFETVVDETAGEIFIVDDDRRLIERLVAEEFAGEEFWPAVLANLDDDSTLNQTRKELLRKLAAGQTPKTSFSGWPRQEVDRQFGQYCERTGLEILKVVQTGVEGVKRRSYVYLVLDSDGIIKIYKELLDYNSGRLGNIFDNEDRIYKHLPQVAFLPRYYGRVNVAPELAFIKQSVHFGQTLEDYVAHERLSTAKICYLVKKVAEELAWLHRHNVLYLDLKPANILFNGSEVQLLDLGISRILKPGEREVDIISAEPRYVTPEGAIRMRASKASDVYQLGLLFHELLTGSHAFCPGPPLSAREDARQAELLNYLLPALFLPYSGDLANEREDGRLKLIRQMLEHDPDRRPTLEQVIETLGNESVTLPIRQPRRKEPRRSSNNTILFPARMGIPHRGHIEYIARLLELGFHVTISLQRAYTLTDRDPIPKSLVAKMVAQSLFTKGFGEEDFDFIFTPFFRQRQQLQLHFAMMPGGEDVIGVASGNSGIHELFSGLRIFDQKAVFGFEAEDYRVRSWGEIIRSAAKTNDRETFKNYAASGVERIRSLDEIRSLYGNPPIDFISRPVQVVLLDESGAELIRTRALRYLSPEESLAAALSRTDRQVRLYDRFERLSRLAIGGRMISFDYLATTFNQGEATIFFNQT